MTITKPDSVYFRVQDRIIIRRSHEQSGCLDAAKVLFLIWVIPVLLSIHFDSTYIFYKLFRKYIYFIMKRVRDEWEKLGIIQDIQLQDTAGRHQPLPFVSDHVWKYMCN